MIKIFVSKFAYKPDSWIERSIKRFRLGVERVSKYKFRVRGMKNERCSRYTVVFMGHDENGLPKFFCPCQLRRKKYGKAERYCTHIGAVILYILSKVKEDPSLEVMIP